MTSKALVVLHTLLALAASINAPAQNVGRPELATVGASRVSVAPVIDGIPNDSVWRQAIPLSSFTQRELVEGAPATERTEVRIIYDQRNLYIGVSCFDFHANAIVANELKRDFNIRSLQSPLLRLC